jgi:protocatechuate 4,5-dioxygenase, beta chain
MGRIIGGVGSSHAPTFGTVWDKGQQHEPMWAPLFDGYVPVRHWLEGLRPDLFIIFYNDHMNRFFLDAYPTFAIGAAEVYPQADEGWGKRKLPDMKGDVAFSWHLARSLVEDEFDPTMCQEMSVDHGVMSYMPMLSDTRWPVPIVPIAVNVIQHPLPTARRLYKLGAAVRRAVESYPQDIRVVVIGTGGLSHQLHGANFGFVNQDWDNEFLDRLESDPEPLAALSHSEYMERGGTEGIEMINWLPMRSSLGPTVKRVARTYHAPLITGYGVLALEPA